MMRRAGIQLRRLVARSWWLSKIHYVCRGLHVAGRPNGDVWYFAFGANMHASAFQERRRMKPLEARPGKLTGFQLRFNLEGRPRGRAAPANLEAVPGAEVWGVLYRIKRKDLLWLDCTEGVPGRRYRHVWTEATDENGCRVAPAVTYIAPGKEQEGNPSERYLTLLREGARAHGLPERWCCYLESVHSAEDVLGEKGGDKQARQN